MLRGIYQWPVDFPTVMHKTRNHYKSKSIQLKIYIYTLQLESVNSFWKFILPFLCYLSCIAPSHKSHNASDKYPIMHLFVKEMCTHVHISVTKLCIVAYRTGALRYGQQIYCCHILLQLHWTPLQWRHNGHDCISNHQPHHCLLKDLFRRRSKKTSKLRVTGLCEGNSPGIGEFPAQRASNMENVSIW